MFWPTLDSDSRNKRTESVPVERTQHVSVLLDEVLEQLAVARNGHYLDLTLGGGGHAEAILKKAAPKGTLVGVDCDQTAMRMAGERLRSFKGRVRVLYGSLEKIEETLDLIELEKLSGVLIDCGLSMDQLKTPRRGFSFQLEAPLDMRLDPTEGIPAWEWLQDVSEKELARVIYEYGEERFSRRIAKAIVHHRKKEKIRTTTLLAEIIARSVPARSRSRKIHPATRSFQGIRIFINRELEQLEHGLEVLLRKLPKDCRLVVISFHSLEDRIVKTLFREKARASASTILTKKPIRPGEDETGVNPASRSAKLRAIVVDQGERG